MTNELDSLFVLGVLFQLFDGDVPVPFCDFKVLLIEVNLTDVVMEVNRLIAEFLISRILKIK